MRKFSNVFCLVFFIIFAICFLRLLLNLQPVTLTGFLDFIHSAPNINMTLSTFETFPTIAESGLLLDLYRFFNLFIGIANILVYAFKGLAQVVLYIVWFVRFLFV